MAFFVEERTLEWIAGEDVHVSLHVQDLAARETEYNRQLGLTAAQVAAEGGSAALATKLREAGQLDFTGWTAFRCTVSDGLRGNLLATGQAGAIEPLTTGDVFLYLTSAQTFGIDQSINRPVNGRWQVSALDPGGGPSSEPIRHVLADGEWTAWPLLVG